MGVWIQRGIVVALLIVGLLTGCSSNGTSKPDIELSLPSQLEVEVNLPGSLVVNLNRKNLSSTAPVKLELENPPASLNAPAVTVTNSKATIIITPSTEGTYNLKLKVTSDKVNKTVSFTLHVKKVVGFGLTITPTQLNLSPSQKGRLTITVKRDTLPSSEPVRVRLKNPPAEISSTPIRINGNAGALDVSASKLGTYELTLLAIGGNYKKEIPIILKVGSNTLVKDTVVSNLEVPWDLTFTPDGILYFTERKGTIKRLVNGVVETITHALPVWAETEAGLMGIDFDPDYPTQPYFYACYSYRPSAGGISNRVSRLELSGQTLSNEKILIDDIPGNTNHNGCRITFGPDKLLYITTGDANDAANSRDPKILSGKVLRIHPEGDIPDDNPFGNAVWSYGHRNAQGIVFHSNGKLYSSEHGESSEDEINLISKGGNYGWPDVEGLCNTPSEQSACEAQSLVDPILVFTPVIAPAGLSFYSGDMFPEWKGDLLVASLRGNKLHRIILDNKGQVNSLQLILEGDYGRLRDIEVAPDGSIYIAVSNRDGRGAKPFPLKEDDRIIRWSKQ